MVLIYNAMAAWHWLKFPYWGIFRQCYYHFCYHFKTQRNEAHSANKGVPGADIFL